ncbi:MAG: hypothetical protein WBL63_14650 [Candidatus Acidiferrum sp.]
MPSFGWFPCHHCVQGFHLLKWPIPNLHDRAKVFVICPGCKNTLEFFAFEIDIIWNGEPGEGCAEVLQTGPVEPMPKNYIRNMSLLFEITRRRNAEQYGLHLE